jgi:hypothetical protein
MLAAKDAEKGGLASTVAANEKGTCAGSKVKIYAVKHVRTARVFKVEVLDLNTGISGG